GGRDAYASRQPMCVTEPGRRGGDRRRFRELVAGRDGVWRRRCVFCCGVLRRYTGLRRLHVGDEPIAASRHRLNELRLMTLVAERTAQHRYRVDQAVVRDDDVVPDRADDLVLADAPVSMLDQINERVESARRQRNRLAAPIEHPLAKIDGEVVELEA